MKLAGRQIGRIRDALLDAFRTRDKLKQMVRIGLDVRLDDITSGQNLSDTVFALIEWAEANNKVHDLITAASEEVPNNTELQALLTENLSASEDTLNQDAVQTVDNNHLNIDEMSIYDDLLTLIQSQFDEVCFRFAMPPEYQQRATTQAQLSMELIRYARRRENGLQELKQLLTRY